MDSWKEVVSTNLIDYMFSDVEGGVAVGPEPLLLIWP